MPLPPVYGTVSVPAYAVPAVAASAVADEQFRAVTDATMTGFVSPGFLQERKRRAREKARIVCFI